MARCKDSLRDGIFEPAQLADIEIAFLKAERHIRRSGTAFAPTVDRRELARRELPGRIRGVGRGVIAAGGREHDDGRDSGGGAEHGGAHRVR